jgi:phosphoglycolate phosphatase
MVNIRCGDRVFNHIQAVIFDKDGTLSNSAAYLRLVTLKRWEILSSTLPDPTPADFGPMLFQAWGLRHDRVDPKGMLAVASQREEEIFTAGCVAALGYSWIEALAIVQASFATAAQALDSKHKLTPAFPGILPLLQQLRTAGLKLGILSADVLPNIHSFIHQHQFDPYFDFCQGEQAGLSKPDPQLLALTCNGLGIEACHVLVIGDSSADIELAKQGAAAGAIGVSWGWHEHFDIPNADVMLRSVDQIQIAP